MLYEWALTWASVVASNLVLNTRRVNKQLLMRVPKGVFVYIVQIHSMHIYGNYPRKSIFYHSIKITIDMLIYKNFHDFIISYDNTEKHFNESF